MSDLKNDFIKPLLLDMIPDGLKLIPCVGSSAVVAVGLAKKVYQTYNKYKDKCSEEEALKKALGELTPKEKACLNNPTVDMLREMRINQVSGKDELLPYLYRLVLICAKGKKINDETAEKIKNIIVTTENPAITGIIEDSDSEPEEDDVIGAEDFASRIKFSENFVFFEIVLIDNDYVRPDYDEESCIAFMKAMNKELGDDLFDEFVPYTLEDLDEAEYDDEEECDDQDE